MHKKIILYFYREHRGLRVGKLLLLLLLLLLLVLLLLLLLLGLFSDESKGRNKRFWGERGGKCSRASSRSL